MDYLVFANGLLLFAAALAAVFRYRREKVRTRWIALAFGLVFLGCAGLLELVSFALPPAVMVERARMVLLAAVCGCFACHALSPLVTDRRWYGLWRIAVVGAAILVPLVFGSYSPWSRGIFGPLVLVSLVAGWRMVGGNGGVSTWLLRVLAAVALTWVAVVQALPNAVEITYDLQGLGHSSERIRILAALAISTVGALLLPWLLRWPRPRILGGGISRDGITSVWIVTGFLLSLVYGAWVAHWLGDQARGERRSVLLSAIRLGVSALDPHRVAMMEGKPEENGSAAFNALRNRLVQIKEALPEARFVYLFGQRRGEMLFLVDAEDPKSPDVSPPGTEYPDSHENIRKALEGVPYFSGPDKDEWGVWFTATLPIRAVDGRVVGSLGVDYPARYWLRPVAERRLAAMGMISSLGLLLLALLAFHAVSTEKSKRMDLLSERLSDAMDAAEFDTWEWFPRERQFSLGSRIKAVLGYTPGPVSGLGGIWNHVHPAERAELRRMLKTPFDSSAGPKEVEIRLRDSNGDFLWFMVRGRVISTDEKDRPQRVVGTILNIDDLERQRRFAQHVMESVPNGLAVVDSAGRITYANAAFAAMSERAVSSLAGLPVEELLPAAAGDAEGAEAELRRPDGGALPVQIFRAQLSDTTSQTGSILSITDLSLIKKAERELESSRVEASRLALVAKLTDNAVVIIDRENRIEWVNEAFTRISGYPWYEVVGKSPAAVLHPADAGDDSRARMLALIEEGAGFQMEIRNLAKDGRPYLVHMECQPLVDKSGDLSGFMVIERDVTRDRRSANLFEAVASVSSSLLSNEPSQALWNPIIEQLGKAAAVERCYLFKHHPHPVTGEPAMSQLVEWNSGFATPQISNPALQNESYEEAGVLRWFAELSAGREIAGLVGTLPECEQPILRMQEILSVAVVPVFCGETYWGFIGFDACAEERVWESWEIGVLRSAAANIGLRLVADQESDALRSTRDQARQAADAAERATRAKSVFLATMSHEIRTPLNAVIGMASLLETTGLNLQQKDYAETILRSSHFLLELINDILDYSRIESGRIELDASPFSLATICKEAFDVVRVSSMGKNLEMISRIAPGVPWGLHGDGGRLRQILVNLLGNAIKFTPSGFVSLSIEGEPIGGDQWRISFAVADSGIGIAPESLDRLFKAFIQEDSTTTRRFGGSGLGLAISKSLAKLMGGDINVASDPGKGSVFTLTVKLSLSPGIKTYPDARMALPPGINPKTLIIDDNETNLRILEEILSQSGIKCASADSPAKAFEVWREQGPFDLVMTDHRMPGMDGVEFVKKLRELPGAIEARTVLLGSESHYGADVRTLFDEISSKPIWPVTIQAMLGRLFPQATLQAPPGAADTSEEDEAQLIRGLRVLVAEDNPNNQKVIRLLMGRLGIEPKIVSDGAQAVEAVSKEAFDVLFLDIQMPVMDGLETSRRLRDDPPPHRPRVIALTANAFQEDRDAAINAGMDDYLAKPVTLARLRETLVSAALATL